MRHNRSVLQRLYGNRRRVAVLLYMGASATSYVLAFLFRFDFNIPAAYLKLFAVTVIPFIVVRLAAFRAFRLTRERWRYAGTRDAVRLAAGTALGSLVLIGLDVLMPFEPRVPLAIILMESILTCWLTAGLWISYRLGVERLARRGRQAKDSRRVLIVGAGEAGSLLVREMLRVHNDYIPAAFVDDEPGMWGAAIHGVEVIGSTADLPRFVAALEIDELIIAVPSLSPSELRRIVERCEATGVPFKVLPGIRAVLAGHVTLNQLREVRIEDLLGREPITLELPELGADLHGSVALITGAAGSIGSELARQIAMHRPKRLLLLDQAETDLFYLDLELRGNHPQLDICTIVGDIVDQSAVEQLFRTYKPDRVYHAAAYKHVPMMESNAREAIRNNVIGTWRIAEAAGRYGAAKFILVSTDKAVRPANVMGATKRLAELAVLELQGIHQRTIYGAVRFGNVLGSNGSVIPLFNRQLHAGKPLTVTHPETTRYFMTIPEAVQLILQASLLPELRGHIAMLDMGEPVKIVDLAHNLLRLSGVKYPEQNVVFTGLRPGEKLHEELSAPDEDAVVTVIPKVRILKTTLGQLRRVTYNIAQWEKGFAAGEDQDVVNALVDLFPGLRANQMLTLALKADAAPSRPAV